MLNGRGEQPIIASDLEDGVPYAKKKPPMKSDNNDHQFQVASCYALKYQQANSLFIIFERCFHVLETTFN